MSHKFVMMSVVVLMLLSLVAATVGVSYAQGPGGDGHGNRPGGPPWDNGDDDSNGIDSPHGMRHGQMDGIGVMSQHMYGYHHGFGDGMNGQAGQNGYRFGPCLACLPPATEGELPDDVATGMMAGLMDEYNAYALYQAVIDQFGEVAPFVNIQAAEGQHIAAHQFRFDRYGLEYPPMVVLEPAPVFDSLQEACQMAVDAENANMNLYDEWIATVQDYPDLVQVFTALRNASQFNHLPAFERCASR